MSLPQPVLPQQGSSVQPPAPVPSQPPGAPYPLAGQPPAVEGAADSVPADAPAPVPANPAWLPPAVPVPGDAAAEQAAAPPVEPVAVPLEAHDSDLIEKSWVIKAKEIVSRTKQDPYHQTRELGRLRAEYMQKRYDKMMEVPEGS